MHLKFKASLILGAITLVVGCQKMLPKEPESNLVLAGPVDGLTSAQLALHISGDEDFAHVFGTAEGLGPIFVQNACESCHAGDGKGHPSNNLTRFGRYDSADVWDPVISMGGPQLQHRAILNYTPESIPAGVASSQFIAPNVTGLGYFAAVSDATILAMVDENDANGDGISGTVNYITAPSWLHPDSRYHQMQPNGKYIGRFGRKSAAIDLTMQTVGAYKQDMGITSDFDMEDPVNPYASPFAGDEVPDPEIGAETIQKVVFYLQTLKAPERRNMDDPDVIAGENIFNDIGCGSCHKATLTTGPSEIAALNQVAFHPYSDMLLHDMGIDLNDNYTEGEAATSEWRTMPLWGLGLQHDSQGGMMYFLHDGRATSFDGAIQYHGGEAASSRAGYNGLPASEKEKLVSFLESL